MNLDFYKELAESTAHRKCRDDIKNFIFSNPKFLKDLVEIALLTHDKNHHKACWVLELVCEEQMELFEPFVENFCTNINKFTNDSAIRSVSKIGMFLSITKKVNLSENQENQIIESSFDWLIQTDKAANACYAMRTLYNFSKKHTWIQDELKTVLSRDCSHQTPGYKFAVRDILKKLTAKK